eukprot:193111-Chlamydomonas_euryale.AAC.4
MDYGATYGQGGSMSGQPAGGGMDWYTPSTGYNYGTGGLTAGSISSAAYQGNMGGGAGSFEEEPPLLEGATRWFGRTAAAARRRVRSQACAHAGRCTCVHAQILR